MRTRNKEIHLRLNEKELQKLDRLVQKSGLTRQAYLRHLINGLQPKELPPPDFRPMMRQLYYCGNNLNQIARKAHSTGAVDAEKYDDAVAEFHRIVAALTKAVVEPEKLERNGGY